MNEDLDIAVGPDACSAASSRWRDELLEAGASRRARRHRHRAARPGRALDRPPDQPADHARLGRLRRARTGSRRLGAPTLVDNDVNLMALGEHFAALARRRAPDAGQGRHRHRQRDHQRRRAAPRRQGAAGDLGHVAGPGGGDVACRCGNTGCLEAIACGAALAAALRARGHDTTSSRDVVALARSGSVEAVQLDPGGRPRHRRGARHRRQPAQPVGDRDRRRPRRGAASTCWPASARSSTGARCRWPPSTCGSCPAAPGSGPGSSAPRSWSWSACSPQHRWTSWSRPRADREHKRQAYPDPDSVTPRPRLGRTQSPTRAHPDPDSRTGQVPNSASRGVSARESRSQCTRVVLSVHVCRCVGGDDGYQPSAAATTSRASSWIRPRWSGPRKLSA